MEQGISPVTKDRFTKLELEETIEVTAVRPTPRTKADKEPLRPDEPVLHKGQFGTRVKDAQYHMEQALKRELEGSHEDALRSYSAALGENPLLLDAWLGQLVMLLELGEYPEARVWADKALESFPDHPSLLAAKAVAFHRMGRRREARDISDAAVQVQRDVDFVWLCRGELMLEDSGPASEHCFTNAVRISPDKPRMKLRIGAVLNRYGYHTRGLTVLREAVGELADSAWLWHLLGSTQEDLGLSDEAMTSFKRAAQLAPLNQAYKQALVPKKRSLTDSVSALFRRLFNK